MSHYIIKTSSARMPGMKTYQPAVGNRDPYVIIFHKPTRRSFVLNRQYELVREQDWVAGIPFGWEKVNECDGWKPTLATQMPAWAVDLPKAEFFAFWVEPKRGNRRLPNGQGDCECQDIEPDSDWLCPTCGCHDCPGCQPHPSQTLSCFLLNHERNENS